MTDVVYTVAFPFCGCGLGARGFLDSSLKMVGQSARFRSLGGIDFDVSACRNFEYLTESRSLCRDVATLTVPDVVGFFGAKAPDVVFMSPPCQGASGLLSDAKSKTEKYSAMNELAIVWTCLMLDAWKDAPPRMVLLENVPRLKTRAAGMLRKVRGLLREAGYVFHDGYHDCGELGGLAQHRRRYLLVARHEKRVPPLLYQPIKRRVRAVGEVLGPMPMPEDPAAGPMHRLPRISWLNWVRLALIPAGGDWRDLPGVLADGEARRAKYGAYSIADPRLTCEPRARAYGVLPWSEAAKTVTGAANIDNGSFAIADPRTPDAPPVIVVRDPKKPPSAIPVIISADGTWHRPLTTLELAALQGFPLVWRGAPLKLDGSASSQWRTHIGNAVPAPAAKAIAERMLASLLQADFETFSLDGDAAVWVQPEGDDESIVVGML